MASSGMSSFEESRKSVGVKSRSEKSKPNENGGIGVRPEKTLRAAKRGRHNTKALEKREKIRKWEYMLYSGGGKRKDNQRNE